MSMKKKNDYILFGKRHKVIKFKFMVNEYVVKVIYIQNLMALLNG